MKKHISIFLASFVFIVSLLIPGYSEAYTNCKYVPGHWSHGRWINQHRVCWSGHSRYYNRGHCYWVPAHRYHGYWINGRKVCGYNR